MKSSEVLRWAYRHNADFSFRDSQGGSTMTISLNNKKRGTTAAFKLMIRDHDKAADDICRFLDKLSVDLNLE